jgi:hypothetical protein
VIPEDSLFRGNQIYRICFRVVLHTYVALCESVEARLSL